MPSPGGPLDALRLEVMSSCGLPSLEDHRVDASGALPPALLAALRVLAAGPEQLQRLRQAGAEAAKAELMLPLRCGGGAGGSGTGSDDAAALGSLRAQLRGMAEAAASCLARLRAAAGRDGEEGAGTAAGAAAAVAGVAGGEGGVAPAHGAGESPGSDCGNSVADTFRRFAVVYAEGITRVLGAALDGLDAGEASAAGQAAG